MVLPSGPLPGASYVGTLASVAGRGCD